MAGNEFKMKSEEVWLYSGESANWHFVSVPKGISAEIKERFGEKHRGWGSLPVMVIIGKTSWKTSIFPDRKSGGYLLPLKAEVRRKEGIRNGDKISFLIRINA